MLTRSKSIGDRGASLSTGLWGGVEGGASLSILAVGLSKRSDCVIAVSLSASSGISSDAGLALRLSAAYTRHQWRQYAINKQDQ